MKKIITLCLILAIAMSAYSTEPAWFHASKAEQNHFTQQLDRNLHRRAADVLETYREAEPELWGYASLDDQVRTYYRPDMDEVAYYEIKVLPRGFMVLSSGPHDFPVVHMSPEGDESPGETLERLAAEQGQIIARAWRVDTITYVGENAEGEKVAQLGELPYRLVPLPAGTRQAAMTVTLRPGEPIEDDEQADFIEREIIEEDIQDVPFDQEPWDSWEAFKAGFAENYALPLEKMREGAAQDWETDELAAAYGEGIRVGSTHRHALLFDDAVFELEGEGAAFVNAERIEREPGSDAIALTAYESLSQTVDFTLHIDYTDGTRESFLYFIAPNVSAKQGPCVPLTATFAGIVHDQRRYTQFDISGCPSGCGPAAWAMVFGWADHQAWKGNSQWRHRWGIYRQNGAVAPAADADAPQFMTSGIRNVTHELRNHMGTWCFRGEGVTNVFAMWAGAKYLTPRTGTTARSRVDIFFNLNGATEQSLDNNRTPVVIGTGFYRHHPSAWGYVKQCRLVRSCFIWCWQSREYGVRFKVNQGWSGFHNQYISNNNFFLGEIFAN